jgi:multidrug efflux pump
MVPESPHVSPTRNGRKVQENQAQLAPEEAVGTPPVGVANFFNDLRLRPIIMTPLAFVFGVLPMALAKGAASASQHSVGTAVIGGTLAATFLAIFLVPLFYVVVTRLFSRKKAPLSQQEAQAIAA